jgi:hypothetical protein
MGITQEKNMNDDWWIWSLLFLLLLGAGIFGYWLGGKVRRK